VPAHEHWLIGPRPEEAIVTIVHLTHLDVRRIQTDNHPSVDTEDWRRIAIDSLHVRDAAAASAVVKGNAPFAPQVRGRGLRIGRPHDIGLASVRIGPERTIAPADRTIAVHHPVRRRFEFEANRAAMARSLDHRSSPRPPENRARLNQVSASAISRNPDTSLSFFLVKIISALKVGRVTTDGAGKTRLLLGEGDREQNSLKVHSFSDDNKSHFVIPIS
jgi:hypothetical protein